MKRARRKAAARFSRPEGSGNRFAATRARDFSESCRSTPPHPSRPFQAAPPSPQGEGGAVFCFCLPFTRPRRSLPPCHGAPGSSRPTAGSLPLAIQLPLAWSPPRPGRFVNRPYDENADTGSPCRGASRSARTPRIFHPPRGGHHHSSVFIKALPPQPAPACPPAWRWADP